MKVLYYDCNDKNYKWVTVPKDSKSFYGNAIMLDNARIYDTQIMKIIGDFRKKYVVCSECGELVLNTEDGKAKHITKRYSQIDCENCKFHQFSNEVILKQKYKKQEDGTYIYEKKSSVKLFCERTWYSDKTPQKAIEEGRCTFVRCRNSYHKTLHQSIFNKYPKLKNISASVNALNEKWHLSVFDQFNGSFIYRYMKSNLYVHINKKGVIEGFEYGSRHPVKFYYSATYNKVFTINYNTAYTESDFEEIFPEGKLEKLTKAVKQVYKKEGK